LTPCRPSGHAIDDDFDSIGMGDDIGDHMGDDTIAAAVEQFVKKVSFSMGREVERVVRTAVADGKLQSHETFTAAVTVSSEKIGLITTIYSKIEL
jgi:hypothetical protein